MDLGLKGKKALVTGGSKGIGRATAELLASEGADVAICARNADEVSAAVDALKSKGVNAIGSAVDVGDGDAYKKWIGQNLGLKKKDALGKKKKLEEEYLSRVPRDGRYKNLSADNHPIHAASLRSLALRANPFGVRKPANVNCNARESECYY